MTWLAIGANSVRRLVRDRSNIFFVFIFPMALILIIGSTFGSGSSPHVAVVATGSGSYTRELVDTLTSREALVVDRYADEDAAREAVARGQASAGLLVPADYDRLVTSGDAATLEVIARQETTSIALETTIQAAVARQNTIVQAARFATSQGALPADQALSRARMVAAALPGVTVDVTRAGTSVWAGYENLGQFDLGASQELTLFMFLTSLAGSAALIQTRQWGVARRMLSTPTPAGAIVVGETLGRFGVAFVQGAYIVLGTVFVFGVSWGDWLGTFAVVVLFGLVSAGAGILMGSTFANDQQASGIGIGIGLGFAALGGAMAPLEVFSPTMQKIAHITPHAWAIDAFAELVRHDGTIVDILPQLGVLAAYAVVLLAVSTVLLRRSLLRSAG